MALELTPITLAEAKEYIKQNHRHHGPPVGHKYSIGLRDDGKLVGVVVVGRPSARGLDDGKTAEATRLCTDGTPNACSMLYSAAWRSARAMGYKRMVTYILNDEPGTSLKASGWKMTGTVKGRSWSCQSRKRTDKHPLVDKQRWEVK